MAHVREVYQPVPCAADSDTQLPGDSLGGFVCTTDGTITLTQANGYVILQDFPVTAGVYHPLNFLFAGGGVITTADGASGTIGN